MHFPPLALVLASGLCSTWAIAQPSMPCRMGWCHRSRPPKPGRISARRTRGDIYMARKMYREAIEAFREGSPKDAVLQNKIGIAYHQMQQLDAARKCYQLAIRLKPDYVEAENNLGTVYYARKNFRKAIGCYRKAITMIPEGARQASIYSNMGTAYFARKQYQLASRSLPDGAPPEPGRLRDRAAVPA